MNQKKQKIQLKDKKVKEKNEKVEKISCTCTKSGCNKNYCECYKNKTRCHSLCRCRNCENIQKNETQKNIDKNECYKANSIYIMNNKIIIEDLSNSQNGRKIKVKIVILQECKNIIIIQIKHIIQK